MLALLKRPSAFLPPAISAFLIALILMHVARGTLHESDEGTAAHLFQLLMPAQALIAVFFAIKWLPQCPKQALQVLALQGAAALTVLSIVFFLRL